MMFPMTTETTRVRPKSWMSKLNKLIETVPEKVKNLSEPVTLIQAHYRAYVARKKYKQLQKAVIRIQCSWKRVQAQRELEKRRQAAEIIRSFVRGFITRRQPESDVNRMFLRHLRVSFLYSLASKAPTSVSDKSWPVAPSACKEASEVLRKMHRRILVRNYFLSLTPERIAQLKWKLEASELFKGKKSSYPKSLETPFVAENIPDHLRKLAKSFEKAHFQVDEDFVYCQMVVKYDRRGYKERKRIVLLSTKNIHLVDDKFKLKHSIPYKIMTGINVSSMNDGLVILRFPISSQNRNKEGDLILDFGSSLIEFVSQLTMVSQNRRLVHRSPNALMHHHIGDGRVGTIRFQRGIEYDVSRSKSGQSLIVSS